MHITVIAKEPVAGRVKTRLCPPLTPEEAAEVARACLADTFDAVRNAADRHDDVRAVALIDGAPGPWIPAGFEIVSQRGSGLGERLAAGFDDLGPGLIIGMDTPGADAHFDAAIDALRNGDDAIGLTFDGGYWGIALATVDAAVFDGVPMSSAGTGQHQLAQLAALGRRVVLLPPVHDLDTIDDLVPVAAEAPGGRLAALAAARSGAAG